MEYPKIDTLFERKEDFTVDPSKLKNPAYGLVKEWEFTEKVDGTNIRLCWNWEGKEFLVKGRTDRAQIPGDLLQSLHNAGLREKFEEAFPASDVVIYGEGYGAGIQKGGAYSDTKKFIAFDILVDEQWWLKQEDVEGICTKFGLVVVPLCGTMTLEEAVELVRDGMVSTIAEAHPTMAEGLVGRPAIPLFLTGGKRLILKLKTKDFEKENNGK